MLYRTRAQTQGTRKWGQHPGRIEFDVLLISLQVSLPLQCNSPKSSVHHSGAKVPLHRSCEKPSLSPRANSAEERRIHPAESDIWPKVTSSLCTSILWKFLSGLEGLAISLFDTVLVMVSSLSPPLGLLTLLTGRAGRRGRSCCSVPRQTGSGCCQT